MVFTAPTAAGRSIFTGEIAKPRALCAIRALGSSACAITAAPAHAATTIAVPTTFSCKPRPLATRVLHQTYHVRTRGGRDRCGYWVTRVTVPRRESTTQAAPAPTAIEAA